MGNLLLEGVFLGWYYKCKYCKTLKNGQAGSKFGTF